LNGKSIEDYSLMPLDGTIATVLAPPKYKKLVGNASSFIHGETVISLPSSRRIDKQDIQLSFLLKSESLQDTQRLLQELNDVLINGKSNTGVNEFSFPEIEQGESTLCLRLVYTEMSKFTPWPGGQALVTLKFTEPNPNNREL